MAQQGVAGTREQRADLNEQIPASEFREFMQEMREFKNEMREFKNEMHEFKNEMHEFKAGVVRVLDSIQDDMTDLLKDLGEIRKKDRSP